MSQHSEKDNEQDKLYLPKFCLIPLEARLNKKLPDSAKIYLGEINVLTNKHGYCWAKDEDLAEMKGVSIRTIESWHKDLEDQGFIKRDTYREHYTYAERPGVFIKTKRKIYVIEEPSKKDAEPQNSADRSDPQNSAGINEELLNKEKQQQQEAAAVSFDIQEKASEVRKSNVEIYECLKLLNIPQHEKEWITKTHQEKDVKNAVDWASHSDTSIKTTLEQAIKWACKVNPKAPKNKDLLEKQNRSYAQKFKDLILPDPVYYFDVLHKCVEMGYTSCNSGIVESVEFIDDNFCERVISILKKLKFKTKPRLKETNVCC